MLSETTAVRNAWAASERELQLRITINGQVFNAEDVTDFSYDSGAMNGESLTLGSTYANSIKITFSHIVEKLELQDKITPEIGIKLPDDTWNYTKLGVFIIDSEVKQDRNNGQTSLSATDNMIMLSGNYVPKIAYPAGVIEAITDISNQAGVKLNEANIARLTDTTIGALGKEATYRQAVGYVAQIAGGFAQFDRDGLLNIRELEDPNFRITSDCYMSKGLTKNETFYRIGGMQAEVTTTQTDNDGNENQETVTLQSGSPSGSQIKLTNPAMSQQLLDQLYDQYADINFYPYSLEWFADPNLEAGDWVTIVDNKGNEFKAPALGLTLSFNGGLSGTLKADTTVTSQTTFVYSGQFNQVVTRLHNDFATIAGNHIYKGIDQPIFAKKGDLWYQSVGPDTVMQVYQFDPDTGLYSWVEVGSTKPSRELSDQMDQVKKDITDQSTKIDGAVANANTAVSNSDLATKTASAAKQSAAEAVTVANQANLISSQAQASALSAKADAATALNDASTAKADANTAKANATQAINDAAAAKGQATNALGQASTAIGNAADALSKVANLSFSGRNLLPGTNQGLTNWTFGASAGGSYNKYAFDVPNGKGMTLATTVAYPNWFYLGYKLNYKVLKQNTDYVLSFWAMSDVDRRVYNVAFANGSASNISARFDYFDLKAKQKTRIVLKAKTNDVAFTDQMLYFSQFTQVGGIDIWDLQLVEGTNVLRDWSPAPEDVQIQIDSINGELSQKVSQTTYNVLAGTVDTVSTLAKQNQSTIGTLATKTSVDTVNKTATTAQTLAQQNANELFNKASTNTVDTLTQRVTTAESTLSQTATKAELQVAQTNVDNLKKTVTSNTAGMTANANAIKLKADSSTVTDLDGRVTSLSGQLDVQSDLISAKVTASDVTGMLGNYATQSWSQGQISAAKNEITASVETVKQQVDNINNGGRNLLINSDFSAKTSGYCLLGYKSWEILEIDGVKVLHLIPTSLTTPVGFFNYYPVRRTDGLSILGHDWSFGIDVKGAKSVYNVKVENSTNVETTTISDSSIWTKIKSSGTRIPTDADHGAAVAYFFADSDDGIYLRHPMLNSGTILSDWTLAPEDLATQEWAKSQLAVTDGKITAGITTVTNTLNSTIASATANMATTTWTNTQIDAAKTAINLSVEQSITTSENTLNNNIANATKDMATQTWTKGQLSVTNDNVSASVQKLHDTVSGEITTATTDMATKSWTQGKLDLTDSQITAQISDVKDGLTTKFTTLQQTLSGVQATANNAVTQGQLTLLSDQFTSTISSVQISGRNLLPNTNQGLINWTFGTGNGGSYSKDAFDVPNGKGMMMATTVAYSNWFYLGYKINYKVLKQNTDYVLSFWAMSDVDRRVDNVAFANGSASNISARFGSFDLKAKQKTRIVLKAKTNDVEFTDQMLYFSQFTQVGGIDIWDLQLVEGTNVLRDWSPAPEDQATVADVSSQFTQLQDDINLRVKTGDLISQINLSAGSTLIQSNKIYLSAASTVFGGSAFIPAASIKDLSADYIKAGTLDASKVNLISVNAASITAGIITGANLSINLDSGEILFQKGSIKSVPGRWNNVLDIEIEDGTFSQADYLGNGVRFQDGSIYMTRDVLDWKSDNKRVKGKVDYGTVRYSSSFLNDVPGMMIYGSEGIVVGTSNYTTISPFMPIWSISGSGMSAGQQGLALGSSEKVVIASGQKYDVYAGTSKPTIMVGTTNSYTAPGDWTAGGSDDPAGNGISLLAKSIVLNAEDLVGGNEVGNVKMGGLALACDGRSGYVLSATTYKRTYSGSANMIITENGVYGRVTSARKYKLLDHDAETVIDHAKRILDINPKQWFDKAEVETISQSLTNSTESQLMTDYKFQQYYGFIADDFHDAGLDEVVQFKNGEVDSLAYDRIPMYHNVILKDHETRIQKLERENKELKQQLAAIS